MLMTVLVWLQGFLKYQNVCPSPKDRRPYPGITHQSHTIRHLSAASLLRGTALGAQSEAKMYGEVTLPLLNR